jgi:cbb3-type cytochrome oxidase cytochrome c subunit
VKSTPTIFLAAFVVASISWGSFVLAPQLQVGSLTLTKPEGSENFYPSQRPGLASQGAEVYRSLGCVYCHSQQVRQESAHCDIMLTDLGTNTARLKAVLAEIHPGAAMTPGKVAQAANVPAAEPVAARLRDAGAKIEVHVIPAGPDIARGWGSRQSVAQDYLFDHPTQLGTRRAGPDLSNVGLGKPEDWHLLHLYAPKAVLPDSTMPPYPFLFEKRKMSGTGSPDALKLPEKFRPEVGYEIIPKQSARALAAYLASLRVTQPLVEAPFTLVQADTPASTNSPAK